MADEQTDRIDNIDEIVKSMLVKPGVPEPAPKVEAKAKVPNGKDGTVREEEESEETDVEAKESEGTPRETPGDDETQEDPDKPAGEESRDDEENVDIDAIELDVTIDGEERKVTIKDLKDKYSFAGAIDKRLQEVTEGRNHIQKQANALSEVYTHMSARLQALDSILEKVEAPQVNLDELRVKDPTRYLFEKERLRDVQEKRARVHAEQQKLQTQQEELQQAALIEYSRNEAMELGKVDPEFANPTTARPAMQKMVEGAAYYKFTPAEVNGVMDHRALLVLKDALKWRAQVEKQTKDAKTVETAKIVPKLLMKPGVKKASTAKTTEQKNMQALMKKARSSGKIEDIAATLIVKQTRQR